MSPADDNPAPLLPAAPVEASVERTLAWLEHIVIGLNLCPFAKAPWAKGRIRCIASRSRTPEALLEELRSELLLLVALPPERTETTLLVVPQQFEVFEDFNQFLDLADALVAALGLEGTLQIASFHPRYRFAGTAPDAIDNSTNRSPYPTLHLLRESSIDAAVRAVPEAESIFEANIRTLRELGEGGLSELYRRVDAAL